jgi:hypothetical protein
MMTFEELAASVSAEFLTRPFPSESSDWGIDTMYDFVANNKTEAFELFDSGFLLDMILDIAGRIAYDQEL